MSKTLDQVLDPRWRRSVRRALLRWYDARRRDLPWRTRAADPYATLVSELMLQQTRVVTVIPYFERFMARFPTIQALAAADLDDVLPYWSGLGYYRRCRHLHTAAVTITRDRDGVFPRAVTDLQSLPGVGRYTAGAIASIAFDQAVPVVDGNVRRVITRMVGNETTSVDRSRNGPVNAEDGVAWTVAGTLVPRHRPGDFNQALMELGATVCTTRTPACSTCPVRRSCRTWVSGADPALAPTRKSPVAELALTALALCVDRAVLLRKRGHGGLWSGLWELPSIEPEAGESAERAAGRLLRSLLPGSRRRPRHYSSLVHQLTHRRVTFEAHRVLIPNRVRVVAPAGARWFDVDDVAAVAMSVATRKLITALGMQSARN